MSASDSAHTAARKVVSDHQQKLVSTKLTAAEAKKADGPMMTSPSKAKGRHPWGLTLDLEHETLAKLGIDALPAVGTDVHVHAKARVTSAEERQSEGSGTRRSMRLQVTHMALAHSGARHAKVGKHLAHTVKKP